MTLLHTDITIRCHNLKIRIDSHKMRFLLQQTDRFIFHHMQQYLRPPIKQDNSDCNSGKVYLCLINGILTMLAAHTAAKGTKRWSIGAALWNKNVMHDANCHKMKMSRNWTIGAALCISNKNMMYHANCHKMKMPRNWTIGAALCKEKSVLKQWHIWGQRRWLFIRFFWKIYI
jgi:hypothetical protein